MINIVSDLRSAFGPVRDQGSRPTCLAFATSDTHAGIRTGWSALSCEYLFYHAQRRASRPADSGATLAAMLDAMGLDGQPVESDWPYMNTCPSNRNSWSPPSTVKELFARTSSAQDEKLTFIITALDRGNPVILLSLLSTSFFNPTTDGVVDAATTEKLNFGLRHAMVAVAHGKINGSVSILVRNSWGPNWGLDGHAWLTQNFIEPRIFHTAVLMENVDVSCNSNTT